MDQPVEARAEANPSLCIPRATGQWTQKQVRTVFTRLFGNDYLSSVVVNPRVDRHGATYSQIFVHFTNWPEGGQSEALRQLVMKGESIKVVYSYPFYWKCFKCRPRESVKSQPRGWCGGAIS